jgi:hypothetical protein
MEPQASDAQRTRVRQLGRTIGIAIFGSLVVAFTVICSVQICLQVWAPKVQPTTIGCATGTLRLVEAIDSARLASADQAGEQAALTKFRGALLPAWAFRPALGRTCAGDAASLRRLHAVDRLRYAEEHAVRYGAVDLAKRRQEVKSFIPLLQSSSRESTDRAL